MTENEISRIVVEEALHIHKSIGPGMLESAYTHCLCYRLRLRGLSIRTEVPVPLIFEEVKLECGYRADILVENIVVLEIKSIEAIADIHLAQTLTYLRFLNLKLGLVLNFNTVLMKNGIRRVVNGL
jgi:GxxExxY protein